MSPDGRACLRLRTSPAENDRLVHAQSLDHPKKNLHPPVVGGSHHHRHHQRHKTKSQYLLVRILTPPWLRCQMTVTNPLGSPRDTTSPPKESTVQTNRTSRSIEQKERAGNQYPSENANNI